MPVLSAAVCHKPLQPVLRQESDAMHGRLLSIRLIATLALLGALHATPGAQPSPAYFERPAHLSTARVLVERTPAANNTYVLGGRFISLPGDSPSSTYAVRADCSGFLLAVFERSNYPIQVRMEFLVPGVKRKRPRAEDFVLSIERESGFRRIRHVSDLRPGDLVAHAMINPEDQRETNTTGHVFLVNSVPQRILGDRPLVAGTTQFSVSVIDSNDELLGSDDTRRLGRNDIHPGLGRGTIRLYSDEAGELVGWARTFQDARFYSYDPRFPSSTKMRKAAMGRPSVS
jgi:hypothetical protein